MPALGDGEFDPVGQSGLAGPAVASGLQAGELSHRAELRPQSGSQLKGSWLKRNVQWAVSAQEGLKKALPSPGLCVRVINCSSQLISLAGLAFLRWSVFLAPLGFHQLAVRGPPDPEVETLKGEAWREGQGEGAGPPKPGDNAQLSALPCWCFFLL